MCIELGHRRALPLCGQSCVAGACAPGRRRLCVPGSASECCAGAKLRSGPWRGGGGKDVGCRANIMHNQCNKGQTVFNLHITAICTGNGEQNCFRCATQRRCFFCTKFFCMRRYLRSHTQWRRNEGRKPRMTPRTAQQKTCQSHEFHYHVACAARGPRETYATTGGR